MFSFRYRWIQQLKSIFSQDVEFNDPLSFEYGLVFKDLLPKNRVWKRGKTKMA